jgi:hypothetical protein
MFQNIEKIAREVRFFSSLLVAPSATACAILARTYDPGRGGAGCQV